MDEAFFWGAQTFFRTVTPLCSWGDGGDLFSARGVWDKAWRGGVVTRSRV